MMSSSSDNNSTFFNNSSNKNYIKKFNNSFNNIENAANNNNINNNTLNNVNNNYPRTIKIFNNNVHTYNDDIPMDFSFEHINNINQLINNNDLNSTYNNNQNYILQNSFNQSLSSINSSINALSPPISRVGSPLKFIFDKKINYDLDTAATTPSVDDNAFINCNAMIDSILNEKNNASSFSMVSNPSDLHISQINFQIFDNHLYDKTFNYNLSFTSLSLERFKLLKDLSKTENLNDTMVMSILQLFEITNLDLKLYIFKNVFSIDDNSINLSTSSLTGNWLLSCKLNENINHSIIFDNNITPFQLYKFFMIDFINLLLLLNQMTEIIFGNNPITDEYYEKLSLIQFKAQLSQENCLNIADLTLSNYTPYDHQYLNNIVYLLWKTESPSVCSEFRQLISN